MHTYPFVVNDSPWNLAFVERDGVQYLKLANKPQVSYIFRNDDHRPACLTTNVKDNIVFWTDNDVNGLPVIYNSPLNVSSSKTIPSVFVDAGIYDPQGIAYDWIARNIYFVDSKVNQIIVCPTTTLTRCAIVLRENSGTPFGIALDPNEG